MRVAKFTVLVLALASMFVFAGIRQARATLMWCTDEMCGGCPENQYCLGSGPSDCHCIADPYPPNPLCDDTGDLCKSTAECLGTGTGNYCVYVDLNDRCECTNVPPGNCFENGICEPGEDRVCPDCTCNNDGDCEMLEGEDNENCPDDCHCDTSKGDQCASGSDCYDNRYDCTDWPSCRCEPIDNCTPSDECDEDLDCATDPNNPYNPGYAPPWCNVSTCSCDWSPCSGVDNGYFDGVRCVECGPCQEAVEDSRTPPSGHCENLCGFGERCDTSVSEDGFCEYRCGNLGDSDQYWDGTDCVDCPPCYYSNSSSNFTVCENSCDPETEICEERDYPLDDQCVPNPNPPEDPPEPPSGPYCGDLECNNGEDMLTCPGDCMIWPSCDTIEQCSIPLCEGAPICQ